MALAYDPYYDLAEANLGVLDEPTPMVSDEALDKIQFGLMGAGLMPGPTGSWFLATSCHPRSSGSRR